MSPTQKQLDFIKVIIEETNAPKFTGTTKTEASAWISKYKPALDRINFIMNLNAEMRYEMLDID